MAMGQIYGKQIVDNSIDGAKLKDAPNGVTTGKINDDAVDAAKLDTSDNYDFATAGGDIYVTDPPATDASAAPKSYVDAMAAGLDLKRSVRVVEVSGNQVISGLVHTIDGVTVFAPNDRVLLTAQTDPKENGIWLVQSAAWTRPTDFAVGANVSGAFTLATEGSSWEGTGWVCINDVGSDVVGTDNLTFTQFSGAGEIIAGAGLVKSGNTLNVGEKLGTGTGSPGGAIKANADDVEVKVDGSTVEITDVLGDPGVMRVKAGGITGTQINTSVAGNGLTGGGGSALSVGQNATGCVKVNADDVEVVTDDSTIEDDGGAAPAKLRVKAGGITGTQLNASVAGDGLTGGGGSALAVGERSQGGIDVQADSVGIAVGNGIEVTVATPGLVQVKADATGGTNLAKVIDVNANGVAVKVDDDTVKEGASNRLKAATPTNSNKWMTPTTGTGNYQTTGLQLSKQPAGDRYVTVRVNGLPVRLADGNRDAGACYFSSDAGATALAISALVTSAVLYWNGVISGYDLESTDRMDFEYDTAA